MRSAVIGTVLFTTSVGFTTFLRVSVNPWKVFGDTVETLKAAPNRFTIGEHSSKEEKATAQAAEKLSKVAREYGTTPWRIAYCVLFFAVLILANAVTFYLSTAFSRLMLREIVASGRVFAVLSLSSLNLFISTATATLLLLIATILAYPALWFCIPLIYLLTESSVYWLFLFLFGGAIAVWAFGNPSLQTVALLAITPCAATMLVCLISIVALASRDRFRRFCCWILLRCTEKKPITFLVGIFVGIAVIIAFICKLLQAVFWL